MSGLPPHNNIHHLTDSHTLTFAIYLLVSMFLAVIGLLGFGIFHTPPPYDTHEQSKVTIDQLRTELDNFIHSQGTFNTTITNQLVGDENRLDDLEAVIKILQIPPAPTHHLNSRVSHSKLKP